MLLDIQSVPAGQEGWLAFDVTSASNRWLLHPRSNLGIRLYVETEEGGSSLIEHTRFEPFVQGHRQPTGGAVSATAAPGPSMLRGPKRDLSPRVNNAHPPHKMSMTLT